MSTTKEERNILVELQKEKADKFYKQARFLCDNGLWDTAANRLYYSVFHLTHALFICYGLSCHTHTGLINLFHLHFVKTEIIEKDLGAFLARMEQMREMADYNCSYSVTEKDVKDIMPYVDRYFQSIGLLIKEKNI